MSGPVAATPAVSIHDVHKVFRIPHEQVHTLKERILNPFKRAEIDYLQALNAVSFEVGRGEFFGVVGRNGSGKSTLMKCIAGIYGTDKGEIRIAGRLAPFIELGVGFNPELTARDNVLINAIMLGLTPAEARRRYDAIIAFAELEDFVDLKLKNYSSGMHVRLAFAVMAHVDADLLLIDEVLAVGDAGFQQKCHDALAAARNDGATIVLVTHDMNAVQRFCDRAVLLEGGRVAEIGAPRTVARSYQRMNFRRGANAGPSGAAHEGDGVAAILGTWFEDAEGRRLDVLEHAGVYSVMMRVEFRSTVEDPVFGIVITDEQHRMVCALSSDWPRRQHRRFDQGEMADVGFEFRNVLSSGRYFVSPEVAHSGTGQKLMDHRENAASVLVTGGRAAAGVVDLPYEVTLRETTGPLPQSAAPA